MTKSNVIDWDKYGRSLHEYYCQCNAIPPHWDELKAEQQECWKDMARIVVAKYRSDAIEHDLIY